MMRLRRLGGENGPLVPICCLGTMTYGGQNDENDAHQQLDYAVKKRGVNFIDTSELYPVPNNVGNHGLSEKFIGTWLAKNRDLRDQLVIATKVVGFMKNTYVGLGRQAENGFYASNAQAPGGRGATRLTKDQIMDACRASLARLQTDYIDLFYLHWPDRYVPMFGCTYFDKSRVRADVVPFKEIVAGIGDLFEKRLIRHWGLSNETAYGVCEICHECERQGVPKPVALQNNFNLLNRSFEMSSLAEACFHHGISLVAWSPLSGGVLTGKYTHGQLPKGSRFEQFSKFEKQFNKPWVPDAVLAYQAAASEHEIGMTELALRWSISRPCIRDDGCVVIGSTKMSQLEENIDEIEKGGLGNSKIMQTMDEIYLRFKDPVNGI